jgi:hypothetical protein
MKYTITKSAKSLVVTLDTESGKYADRVTTFNDPNVILGNDDICLLENGRPQIYLQKHEIGLIDGAAAANLVDAVAKISVLIDSITFGSDKKIKSNESLLSAQRKDDVLYGILDQYTGEEITLSKVTGTPTVDQVVYFQLGIEYFKRNTSGVVNVKWFGVKSDYSGGLGTNNVISFNNAIASIGANDYLEVPKGDYYFASTITIAKSIKIKSLGNLFFATGSDGFVFDGGNGNKKFDIDFNGTIQGTNTGSAYDSYVNTGVTILNTYNGIFKFDRIQGFKDGLKLNSIGDGASPSGCQYNDIYWGFFNNNKNNILLECTGTAVNWINENRFFGGRLTGKNGVVFKKGAGQTDPFNSNKFYNVGIEQIINGDGFYLEFANNNHFFAPRTAGSENAGSQMIRIQSGCRGNQFYGIYMYESDIIDNGYENLYNGDILTPSGTTSGHNATSTGGKLTILGFEKNITAFNESSNNLIALGKTAYPSNIFAETLINGVYNKVEYTPNYSLVNTATFILPKNIGYARFSGGAGNDVVLKIDPSDYNSGSVLLKNIILDNPSASIFITLKRSDNDAVLVARALIPQGRSQLVWSSSDWRLILGTGTTFNNSVSASSGSAKNIFTNGTTIATANGDELIGYDFESAFSLGAFTGVKSWGARFRGMYSRGTRNLFKPDSNNLSPNVAIIASNNYSTQTYTLTTLGIPAGGKDNNKVTKLLTRMVTNAPSVDGLFYISVGSHTSNSDASDPLVSPETITDVIELSKTGVKIIGTQTLSTAPTTSAGTYDVLTRNTTSGLVEKVNKTTLDRLTVYTVSTLPTGTQGDTAMVTDATAPTYLGTLTGGGSVKCPVFHNGTVWVSH